MSRLSTFFADWRVPLGYPLVAAVCYFARPSPDAIAWGAAIGAMGLLVRGYAAGYLRKHESLTVTGPYARTRNPLYLGSAILSLGFAVAARSWVSGVSILGYFALFYGIVMRREEDELRSQFGVQFDAYSRRVPLFLPRLFVKTPPEGTVDSAFSWNQYRKNREYQAALGFALVLVLLLLIWRFRRG